MIHYIIKHGKLYLMSKTQNYFFSHSTILNSYKKKKKKIHIEISTIR